METQWYLHTDAFTNEALVRELDQAGITEESESEVSYEGRRLRVWQIPFHFVALLEKNRVTFPFSFTILVREGSGKVRRWGLQGRSKLSRHKKITGMRGRIKRL